jgi:signal peptidase I
MMEGISMQPTYYEGDLLLLKKIPTSDITVGDVVVYRRSTSSLLIVHRVVAERAARANYKQSLLIARYLLGLYDLGE